MTDNQKRGLLNNLENGSVYGEVSTDELDKNDIKRAKSYAKFPP